MKLEELEPQFYRFGQPGFREKVATLAVAHGIRFLCPKCFAKNGGPEGTHSVMVWFRDRGVPSTESPGPGRWIASGSGYADLTLSPSINLENSDHIGCEWHGWIQNGDAR
jgi:hypothetical protein